MSRRFTRGFTLIELLVVIAIIGILASVVLVSLQSARKKGNDSRVQSGVQQIRVSLETNFMNNTYPELTGATRFAPRASFGANTEILVADIIAQQNAGGLTASYGVTAAGVYIAAPAPTLLIVKTTDNPGRAYAIYAKLPSGPSTGAGSTFCIDSTGNTKTNTNYPTEAQVNAGATACL